MRPLDAIFDKTLRHPFDRYYDEPFSLNMLYHWHRKILLRSFGFIRFNHPVRPEMD